MGRQNEVLKRITRGFIGKVGLKGGLEEGRELAKQVYWGRAFEAENTAKTRAG